MHTGPVSGDYTSEWKPSTRKCKCGAAMQYRKWESSCGGFEDEEFKCTACANTYWVEGPDA